MTRLALLLLFLFTPLASGQEPAPKVDKWAVDATLYSAADATKAAAADVAALAKVMTPEELYYVRYLWLAAPKAERQNQADAANYVLFSLATQPDIAGYQAVRVGPDGCILRVNLSPLGIDPKVWDGFEAVDNFFHENQDKVNILVRQTTTTRRVEKVWPGGVWLQKDEYYGQHYPPGAFKYTITEPVTTQTQEEVGHREVKRTFATQIDPTAAGYLIKTLQAKSPILHAGWFIVNAFGPDHYYKFFGGLKTLDDFDELVKFDKRAEEFTQRKATIPISGRLAKKVTVNNRVLEFKNTFYGRYRISHDFFSNIGEANVIRNFLNADKKADGHEVIGTLPNGLQAYAIANAQRQLLGKVPVDAVKGALAFDDYAFDRQVAVGIGCAGCHKNGMQPFVSYFKQSVTKETKEFLKTIEPDPKKQRLLFKDIDRIFTNGDFDKIAKEENDRYAAAIKLVNGRTPIDNATNLRHVYDQYQSKEWYLEDFCYITGQPIEITRIILGLNIDGVADPVLVSPVLVSPVFKEGLPVRTEHMEEALAELRKRQYTVQVVPLPKQKDAPKVKPDPPRVQQPDPIPPKPKVQQKLDVKAPAPVTPKVVVQAPVEVAPKAQEKMDIPPKLARADIAPVQPAKREPQAAESEIKLPDFVRNVGDRCLWSCAEMILLYSRYDEFRGVAQTKPDAGFSIAKLKAELDGRHIPCEVYDEFLMGKPRDFRFIHRQLAEGNPVIVGVTTGRPWRHAVIVTKLDEREAVIVCPDEGRLVWDRSEFNRRWLKMALAVTDRKKRKK